MIQFLQDNVNKLIFTSITAIIITIFSKLIVDYRRKKAPSESTNTGLSNTATATVNIYNTESKNRIIDISGQNDSLNKRKVLTKILFIDDDTEFKVVSILKKAGWINTTLTKDIENVDDVSIKDTDIFFVDIQGVGKELGCKDEGLGLALILRKKYKAKKIIIYSAETKGDRFHEALTKADSLLAKNAEPYEFQELVEQYSLEIYPND